MAFEVYGSYQKDAGEKSVVDWEALNKYTVKAAGLQEPDTLIGIVAGIVDLGEQDQPDSEVVFTGNSDDEEAEIIKKPNTYFKDGRDPNTKKPARLKCWPNRPIQCVAVAIDFPDILLDKGQFFGDKNVEPLPLRMSLGDSFYVSGVGNVISRPTPLKEVNIDKESTKPRWSFSPLHLFHKMAVAAKLIKPDDVFKPGQIDGLIGKAFQFQTQIFMRQGKDGKEYLTEKIKFVGGLGRGQTAPENPNETFMVMFNRVNSEESLKNLRSHVINTIKQAKNYNGSVIQKQLGDEVQQNVQTHVPAPEPKRTPAKTASSVSNTAVKVSEDFDDDCPF
jgi:hypothetical protein